MLVNVVRPILQYANIHRFIERATCMLTSHIIDELSCPFNKAKGWGAADPIIVAEGNHCIVPAAFDIDRKIITPTRRDPLSAWRFIIPVLFDGKVVDPLLRTVSLLLCPYCMRVLKAIEVNSRAVVEPEGSPLPCLGLKVSPLSVNPTLPYNIYSLVSS
jgi:hypothetical protein